MRDWASPWLPSTINSRPPPPPPPGRFFPGRNRPQAVLGGSSRAMGGDVSQVSLQLDLCGHLRGRASRFPTDGPPAARRPSPSDPCRARSSRRRAAMPAMRSWRRFENTHRLVETPRLVEHLGFEHGGSRWCGGRRAWPDRASLLLRRFCAGAGRPARRHQGGKPGALPRADQPPSRHGRSASFEKQAHGILKNLRGVFALPPFPV